jgi:hypothetical protein
MLAGVRTLPSGARWASSTADEAQGIVQATQESVEDLGTRPSLPTIEGSAILEAGDTQALRPAQKKA